MGNYYTLIIIDDEKIIREGLRDMVDWHGLGFHVAACLEDGREALDYLAKHDVAAVLTDIKMDDVSGITISQYIKDNLPDTIVVILSGYRDFSFAQQAVECNVRRYLIKPVDFCELESTFTDIKRQIDNRRNRLNLEQGKQKRWNGLLPLAIRQFFTDMVNGRILDADVITERFNQLDLPFSVDRHPCCLLTVSAHTDTEVLNESVRLGMLNTIAEETKRMRWYEIRNLGDRLIMLAVSTLFLDAERFESNLRCKMHDVCTAVKSVFQMDFDIGVVASYPDLLCMAQSRPGILIQKDSDGISRAKLTFANKNPVIERVFMYLDKNFGRNVSLSSAADRAFLSPAYFSKFFRERTGKTFTDYLTDVRIEKAIGLLRENNHSISEISALVGYTAPRYFSRVFRKQTGFGPREYRVQILSREAGDD